MNKSLAVGFVAGLAVAGGSAAAITSIDHPASAGSARSSSAAVRTISDPSPNAGRRVYDDATNSVVFVTANSGQGTATGSGFVVSSDGEIITNEHVVDGAQRVTVKIGTRSAAQPATVLAADASKDLALLKVGASGLKPLKLADSSALQVGDTAYAIGNPLGLDHTFTSGIVSALGRSIQAPDGSTIKGAIQTDAAINPGNSGGALLDASGDVIGVNSQIANANSSGGEAGNVGIGFAIPSNTVKAFIAHPTSTPQTARQAPVQLQSPGGGVLVVP
jgi:putative serine protease PepD